MRMNKVWNLINLLLGYKAIGNKWILKIKYKVNGTIDRYKARLVAKHYTQQEETFSHVIKFTYIFLILTILVHLNLKLH